MPAVVKTARGTRDARTRNDFEVTIPACGTAPHATSEIAAGALEDCPRERECGGIGWRVLLARRHGLSHREMRGKVGVRSSEAGATRTGEARLLTILLHLTIAAAVSGCAYWEPYIRYQSQMAPAPVPDSAVDHRLILIGDAGDADPDGEPALYAVSRRVREMPDRTTVTFLGDNVYERGMPAEEPTVLDQAAQVANVILPKVFDSRKESERLLNAQIDVLRGTVARGIFVPGNHDWDPFEAGGWSRVLQQESFLRSSSRENVDVTMLPEGGCPGPTSVHLGTKGTLIVLDTQWWLAYGLKAKPTPDNNPTGCKYTTENDVLLALVEELRKASREKRWAIVAAHHPLNSAGPHGGYVEPWTHLFPMRFLRHYVPWYLEWIPMPGLGTFAVLARQHFSPSPQDASNDVNLHMRTALRTAMAEGEAHGAPALVYAAGHDHSLQVFKTPRGPRYTLVSGLGATSRASEVGKTHNTLFAHANPSHTGYMQIDFLRNGRVRLGVEESDGKPDGESKEIYSLMIVDAEALAARPTPKPGTWSRLRKRASTAWHSWRGDDDDDEHDKPGDHDKPDEQDNAEKHGLNH